MACTASARRPSPPARPNPVFILTEDGLGTLDVPHFPLARTFDEVMQALAALYTEEHAFRTLVVDSVDWLEPLIHAKVCQDQGWQLDRGRRLRQGLRPRPRLLAPVPRGAERAPRRQGHGDRPDRAHRHQALRQPRESEPYDRYVIKLHSKASALLQEHSDVVLFANYRISTVK